ncbi:hypothetical protein [Acetobacter senegalensis]|uniref:hypothetical protein n=1 Tax=Acetobacter senegalensis TaxID=446692 RepID=UPI00264B67C3|nr:hypothetical protein [Acetobacter senegalensis]MDN7350548.1 hypothetical protein [Acetobacter senegalensis]
MMLHKERQAAWIQNDQLEDLLHNHGRISRVGTGPSQGSSADLCQQGYLGLCP